MKNNIWMQSNCRGFYFNISAKCVCGHSIRSHIGGYGCLVCDCEEFLLA